MEIELSATHPTFVQSQLDQSSILTRQFAHRAVRAGVRSRQDTLFASPQFASKLLRQDHLNVVEFYRVTRDIGAACKDRLHARKLANAWKREINAIYSGVPAHPLCTSLCDTVSRRDIPILHFTALSETLIQDWACSPFDSATEAFTVYTRAADSLAAMFLAVHGETEPKLHRSVAMLWRDLIHTDRLRNISAELDYGRHCLARRDLDLFGVHSTIKSGDSTPSLSSLIQCEAAILSGSLASAALPDECFLSKSLPNELNGYRRRAEAVLDRIALAPSSVLSSEPRLSILTHYSERVFRAIIGIANR